MTKRYRYCSCGLMALLLLLGNANAQTIASRKNSPSLEQPVDEIMKGFTARTPGASVLVLKNDTIVFQKGYGAKQVHQRSRIDPSTNFRLASITKQFTAAGILLLQQRGKLSLNDRVVNYLPNLPDYARSIRILHLLNHSSGLPDYEELIPEKQTEQVHDADCLQLIRQADSLYFLPGSAYRYSNTGYALLALVVEKLSGKSFAAFLDSAIFRPLNMRGTVAYEKGISKVKNRAFGHSLINGNWELTDQSNSSAVLGDGGIYSNTRDLAKWISALWNYRLLPQNIQLQAWSSTLFNNQQVNDYGFGWHVEKYGKGTHPYHSGSSIGFRNYLNLFPEEKIMVVVLTNRNSADPKTLCKKISALFIE
ncbi:MAG TPA: serine hydrolase domain-containing protein [Sediminibacterium sp.]|nr:serine hydrolase domain-containing protein [Sediminibacterium sp.]